MKKIIEKTSKSPEETKKIGEWLSKKLVKGSIVALIGEFGVGKTVFVKGIAHGLEVKDVLHDVISPSFTLVREYNGKVPIYHFDLYRILSEEDLFSIGYEDYLQRDGVVVIEWAEKFLYLFPDDHIKVFFETLSNTERKLTICFPT